MFDYVTINFTSIYTDIAASVGLVKSPPQSTRPPNPPQSSVPLPVNSSQSMWQHIFNIVHVKVSNGQSLCPKFKIRYLHSLLGLVFSPSNCLKIFSILLHSMDFLATGLGWFSRSASGRSAPGWTFSHGARCLPLFMAVLPTKYNWQFRSSPF